MLCVGERKALQRLHCRSVWTIRHILANACSGTACPELLHYLWTALAIHVSHFPKCQHQIAPHNLLQGEHTIEMRTKENVRSLLEGCLVLPLSWHVSMGSCGLETKRCCSAKPLKAGASATAPWGTAAQRGLLLSNMFKGRFFQGLK